MPLIISAIIREKSVEEANFSIQMGCASLTSGHQPSTPWVYNAYIVQ